MVVSSMYAVKTSQNDKKKIKSLEDMTCSGFSDFPFIEDNLNS